MAFIFCPCDFALSTLSSYIGNVLTYIFIAFFTWYSETLSWTKAGALFQMQMASLMAVLRSRFEPPVSTGLPLAEALVEAPSTGVDCWMIFRGCCSSFRDFHISSNLILALIWLTDNMLNLSRSDLIEILSFTFVLFKVLMRLFCMICMDLREAHSGSSFVSLTLPNSWSSFISLT